ncbi:MAG: tol-pal system protein YbgF [Cytophagales bacterium]|nr:tol-pal system protein YbgF [Cytophagales bacterium]
MKYIIGFVFFVSIHFLSFGQDSSYYKVNRPDILLADMDIQLNCTEAIDALYNFEFEKAEKQFTWLKQEYPDHPLPYFLMGLSNWWKIMPNDRNTSYDETFLAYMDSSITFAEELYEKDEKNLEASFFLAGAYGFKARLYSDRESYSKATFAARKSLEFLNLENNQNDETFSPEFLFGTGLYNYFRVWIPENKKFLRGIVMFFPKGDKEKGLEQLNKVSKHAFYTRVEAMNFLISIYSSYENRRKDAWPISKYLAETYPNNAYFQRQYAKLCFLNGNIAAAEKEALSIIDKIEKKYPGYEAESGRYASYFLGHIYKNIKGKNELAKKYFKKAVVFGKETEAFEKSYFLYSLEGLAQIADKEGDKKLAIKYYQEIKEYADNDHSTHKRAKKYLKENGEGSWWSLW